MKAQLNFKIENPVFELFPAAKIAGVLLCGLKPKTDSTAKLDTIKANLLEDLTKAGDSILNRPEVVLWQKVFAKLGLNPKDYQPAHSALLHRTLKQKELPSINQLVDLYNISSLRNLVPIGGHDLAAHDSIEVGVTEGTEQFRTMNNADEATVTKGEFAYLDREHGQVLTRNLVWRQSDYSKITDSTTDMFIPIDDFTESKSVNILADICRELLALFSKFYDFESDFGIASRYNPVLNLKPVKTEQTYNISYLTAERPKVDTAQETINSFFDRKLDQIYPNKEALEQALLSGKRLKFYIGVDATGPKLHIGHAIPVMKMAQLQKMGHQVVFLIGDFTARIGDPTDRSAARVMLSEEEIAENIKLFKAQVSHYVDFATDTNPAQVVQNSTWNADLTLSALISLSANFTVQQMLERDMFQVRLKENKPIYLHEFLYPLIQGYDSVAINVDGEFGGRDQTFNMLAGRTLSKVINNIDKFVITTHFLLSSDGVTKMSKSIGNCIFITDSANDKYAKVMAIPDSLILHYYQLATDLSDAAIEAVKAELDSGKEAMGIKKQLAFTVTELHDGKENAEKAAKYFENTVQNNQIPDDAPQFSRAELKLETGKLELKELLVQTGLAPSSSEAKRLIRSGAVELDGNRTEDIQALAEPAKINSIRVGKFKWLKLVA
jgi:tyrosyl-tRNA synthetase